jgi:hypothetical protein
VFAIRQLSYVHIIEAAATLRVRPAAAGSSGLASVIAVAWTTAWLDVPAILAALTLVLVVVVAAGACVLVRAGAKELRAVYRGQMVSLFSSLEAQEFGQVRRALVRAIENVTDV